MSELGEPCGWDCERIDGGRCDLCEARARKRRDDARMAAGLPTLQHRPFSSALREAQAATPAGEQLEPTRPTGFEEIKKSLRGERSAGE